MEINKELFVLSEQKIKIGEEQNRVKNEINRLEKEGSTGEFISQIKLTIYSEIAAMSNININYIVGGAAWAPKYSMNVEDQKNSLMMDYNANIMNQSGESWDNVNLVISTADPNASNALPALNPWVLNNYSQNQNEGNLNMYGSKKVNAASVKTQTGIEPLQGVELEEITVPDIDIDFKIEDKYTIPSDGVAYTVNVSKNKLNATYNYYCIPKLDKDAFLVAQVSGWEKLNLLEGKNSIFYQGRYIGESSISPQYANDTLDISMGRTSKILTNRIKTEDKNSKKFFENNIIETITYRTTIKNTNTTNISILVEDQLPISQNNSDIKIEAKEIAKATIEQESGSLTWNLNLKPGETKELIVSFSVQYPKSKSKTFKLFYNDISKHRTRSKF